jgi:hypothetical protein
MFPLKNIREHVTERLDTTVTVLRKHRNSSEIIAIEETESNDKRGQTNEEPLLKINITNIPKDNVWIFENEFNHPIYPTVSLNNQKGAFTAAGSKVEKTIILHRNERLYLFMFEMKRTMNLDNFVKIKDKLESALSTMSIFISAHFDFPNFENSQIYPIGICCYNYEDCSLERYHDQSSTKRIFKQKYIDAQERECLLSVEPLTLNRLSMPIVFCANYNNPITKGFDIDLENILSRVTSMFEE